MILKKEILYVLFLGLLASCHEATEKPIVLPSVKKTDTIKAVNEVCPKKGLPPQIVNDQVQPEDTIKEIPVKYLEVYNDPENSKIYNFKFEKIYKKTFKVYQGTYHSSLDPNLHGVIKTDTSIEVSAGGVKHSFENDTITYRSTASYAGFIDPLKLHVISWVNAHNEVAGMYLIDSVTNDFYDVGSCSDYGPKAVSASPNNKFLLTYTNDYYADSVSCILIFSIKNKKGKYSYEPFSSYDSNEWMISDLVWINDKSFALRTYKRGGDHGDGEREVKYYKVSF